MDDTAPTEKPADPVETFRQTLATLTPHVRVTPILVAANVAVFVWMVVAGADVMSPTADVIVAWGGNFAPRTTAGEWWRLLSSAFVHIGVVHMLFNVVVLWGIGTFMERLLGPVGFSLLYLSTALGGSVASAWWHPEVVSAGASGAVFGLYGGLIGALARNRHAIPPAALKQIGQGAAIFVGYNIVFSFQPNVDMAGHLGGLVAGLPLGAAMRVALTREAAEGRVVQHAAVHVAALAVLTLLAVRLPGGVDSMAEMAAMGRVESAVIGQYNDLVKRAQAGQLPDEAFADALEKDVIPPWRRERLRLAALEGLRGRPAEVMANVVTYMSAREEAWVLLVEAARGGGDPALIERARKRGAEAEALLEKLTRPDGD